jgi:antitoxin component HigA of HigAB toxin-antitoxin module
MDFDIIAKQYPVLYDLMGIASVMIYTDSTKRKVVFDYIRNITKKLGIPASVLKDFAEVMYLNLYEVMEEIA